MTTAAFRLRHEAVHPVHVHVEPRLDGRNRLTTAFRPLLAVPHLLLVGGPIAVTMRLMWPASTDTRLAWGDGGVLGAVAFVVALIAWFAIVFTGRFPEGLRALATLYLRWRVRVAAYVALLRDEYPPFGEGEYPAAVQLQTADTPRDRLTVALRPVLIIPHVFLLWFLGVAGMATTVIAWFAILFTGRYPAALYGFGVGVLRWETRVEAYALLLHDEYPPFALD
jgi:hypothetical protein